MAKVNKSTYGYLHNMTQQNIYSIIIQICTTIMVDISHEKNGNNILSKKKDRKENDTIVQLCQNLYVRFK